MRRRRRALYPPYTLIARLLFESDSEQAARQARRGRHAADGSVFRAADVPQKYVVALRVMACPIQKIKGRSRWQVTLQIVDQPICQEAVGKMSEIAAAPAAGCLCVCQINPSSMM
ncbi:MAG: hypothetical protein ACLR4A_12625 [Christensenellales bacterium]